MTKSIPEIVEEFENAFVDVQPEEIGSRWKKVNPDKLASMLRTTLEELHQELQKARAKLLEEMREFTFKACPYEGTMMRAFIRKKQSELDQPTEDKKYCNGEPCICGETNTNQLKV